MDHFSGGGSAVLAGCSAVPDRCPGPPDGWAVYPDPAVAARAPEALPRGLRIVTLGSSSTQGTGASPEATRSYPAQLGRVLNWRHPEAEVEVINKGIAGEITTKNLARLNRDVLALRPDLVLWQVGTNDAIYLGNATAVMVQVRRGIRRIRDAGAGLVLISGQPLPNKELNGPLLAIRNALLEVAREERVPVLDRYKLLEWWESSGTLYPDEIIGPDALHMTNLSYECFARRIADEVPSLVAALGLTKARERGPGGPPADTPGTPAGPDGPASDVPEVAAGQGAPEPVAPKPAVPPGL
jgi:lysophospholipase L1-like esterase